MMTEKLQNLESDYDTFRLEKDLLLLHGKTKKIRILNESAALIWEGLQRGFKNELIEEIASTSKRSHEVVAEEINSIENLMRSWQELGNEEPEQLLVKPEGPFTYREISVNNSIDIALLSSRFTIVAECPELLSCLVPYLDRLKFDENHSDGMQSHHLLEISGTRDQKLILWHNREPIAESDYDLAVPVVLGAIENIAAQNYDYWLALHASCVVRGDKTIVIVGRSQSGKSTLAADLVGAGASPVSDDLVVLSQADSKIIPVPIAFALREGSWKGTEAKFPKFKDEKSYESFSKLKFRYLSDELRFPTEVPSDIQILFPNFVPGLDPGFDPCIRTVPCAEALVLIGEAYYHLLPDINVETMERMINWVMNAERYALSYRSSDEALTLVNSI